MSSRSQQLRVLDSDAFNTGRKYVQVYVFLGLNENSLTISSHNQTTCRFICCNSTMNWKINYKKRLLRKDIKYLKNFLVCVLNWHFGQSAVFFCIDKVSFTFQNCDWLIFYKSIFTIAQVGSVSTEWYHHLFDC